MDHKEINLSNTTSNFSSDTGDPISASIKISVYLLLSVIGTCCNLHNLITIYYTPSLRTLNNFLLIALGINDFLTALIGLPLLIGTTLIHGQTLCNIQGTYNFICTTCSLLLTFSISVDRCQAVILPYSYLRQLTYSKYIFIALTLYFSPMFSSILPLLNLETYGLGRYDSRSSCWISLTPSPSNIVILSLVAFISAGVILVIISCYIMLFYIAYQKSNNHAVDNTVCIKTSLRTVIMIVGTTVVCWIPFVALTITNVITYLLHGNVDVVSRVVTDLVLDLVISNVVINPIIYMWTNAVLKRKLKKKWQEMFYGNKVIPLPRPTIATIEQI